MSLFAKRLRCNSRHNPLGIDTPTPRLSWILSSDQPNTRQTSYRLLVASSREQLAGEEGDLWDSGEVASDQCLDIAYAGQRLASRQRCWWQVQVTDNHGRTSAWSAPAQWSMGLLHKGDWQADWIGWDHEPCRILGNNPVFRPIYLRHGFEIEGEIASATLYATALGWYEARLNGQRVGDAYTTPGWTDPRRRMYYQTYDVSELVQPGANAIGGILGMGWYGWPDRGSKPRFLAQLEIELADGTRRIIGSGPKWRAGFGPEQESHLLFGESYDARQRISGWDSADSQADWQAPNLGLELRHFPADNPEPPHPLLEAYPAEPVRIVRRHRPLAMTEPVPHDVFVFDLGTNFAGFAQLRIRKAPRGQCIRLRFGDWVREDGTLYTDNLRAARHMCDEYICAGDEEEIWQPRFSFRGHQYVELTGWPRGSKPTLETITGLELGHDVRQVLHFQCGNEQVNRLRSIVEQTCRANTIEAPTDCVQRDERQGWGGDAYFSSRAAVAHADLHAFYRKWLVGVLDAQHPDGGFARLAPANFGYYGGDRDGMPGWADIGVHFPWLVYQTYGDRDILEQVAPAIERYIEFRMESLVDDLRDESAFYYGDWNSVDYYWAAERSEWGADTSVAYAAMTAYMLQTAVQIAEVLEQSEAAERYRGYHQRVRDAFRRAYTDEQGMRHPTQGNCTFAIAFELVEGEQRERTLAQLLESYREREWGIGQGIVSTPHALFALSDNNLTDAAYRILLNDRFPSWGYMLRCGATAIWEHWASQRPELPAQAPYFVPCDRTETSGPGFNRRISPAMNSANHPALGSVGDWIFREIGGIHPVAPGYKEILIRPRVDQRIGRADVTYDSRYGPIHCAWQLANDLLHLEVTIPPNTTARLELPGLSQALTSGTHSFETSYQEPSS